MAQLLEFTWKGFGYTAERADDGSWEVTQEYISGKGNGEARQKFVVRAGSKAGMGHIKAALKRDMRERAKVLADSPVFGNKVVTIPNKGQGIVASFNPKTRYAIACAYLGC